MTTSPLNVVLALPQWFTQRPIQPMGLLYRASVARNAGHRLRIIDGVVFGESGDSPVQRLILSGGSPARLPALPRKASAEVPRC